MIWNLEVTVGKALERRLAALNSMVVIERTKCCTGEFHDKIKDE